MASVYVFDSNAVLDVLQGKPESNNILGFCDGARISAVQLAELLNLAERRADILLTRTDVMKGVAGIGLVVVDFNADQAIWAGRLSRKCRLRHDKVLAETKAKKEATRRNLSIADRCCIALAEHLTATVISSDAVWTEFVSADRLFVYKPPIPQLRP